MPTEGTRSQTGDIGKNARVAIGNNISWNEGLTTEQSEKLSRVDKNLRDLTERLVPVPSDQSTRAAIDVKSRINQLLGAAFFGRDAEFETLDRFVEKHNRGLAIVAAPAGAGKSAFLARWADSRRNSGDFVVRHFVSSLYGGTTNSVEMLHHLSAQLREFEISESQEHAQTNPYAEGTLLDHLTADLGRPPPDFKRLIIVIDGLDELVSPLKDVFVRPNLAAGVFVVVSGRAAPDEIPSFLQRWHDVTLGTIPRRRFDVFGLSDAEILVWLKRALGAELQIDVASLARQLQETTDGFPLFLQFVIADLSTHLPQATSPEERAAIVRDVPAAFSRYVARELDDLRNAMGTRWTESVRMLFAVLSRARSPLSSQEIEDFFRFHRRSDATFPACPVLTALDVRVRRWFSIRKADASEHFAFAHPRLTLAFAEVLGAESQGAEDLLIAWMDACWRTSNASQDVEVRRAYALDRLTLHLEDRGRKSDAAILLSSPTFLKEQLRDAKRALARLGLALDHWNRLDPDSKRQVTGAAQWTAFWAENETAIKRAILIAVKAGLNTWQPALQCLGDTVTSGSDVNTPASFCSVTHSPTHKGLIRSIDDAHSEQFGGVKLVANQLVSWNGDGAIRFWSLDGASMPGGDRNAHQPGFQAISSVSVVSDRLVSWGEDGALRFWSLEGDPLPGGDAKAHSKAIRGIKRIGNRLVSWGEDGALRFWSLEGNPLPGGDEEAHSGRVSGVRRLKSRMITWGEDGALRFWSLEGDPLPGGDAKAHSKAIRGITRIGNRIVSWGEDGALRFWSLEGNPLPGGDEEAHSGRVSGVRRLKSRMITWGEDGALRFWSLEGDPLPGGDAKAHSKAIRGITRIGNRIVSWGEDGAIRFWSLNGEHLCGGTSEIYSDSGNGRLTVFRVENRLVSWDEGGPILFWSPDGTQIPTGDVQPLPKGVGAIGGAGRFGQYVICWGLHVIRFWSLEGIPLGIINAHDHWVEGILKIRDLLISWAADGVIRFWSLMNALRPISEAQTHPPKIQSILPVKDRCVSWDSHGGICFWSLSGVSLPGGDRNAHAGRRIENVFQVNNRLVSYCEGGAIRFWSLDGNPVPGGDFTAHSGR